MMTKEKSANELGELLADQIDKLGAKNVTEGMRKNADTIANLVGKIQSQVKLEVSYAKDCKKPIPNLPSMSRTPAPQPRKR
jgi:hypothetical protein